MVGFKRGCFALIVAAMALMSSCTPSGGSGTGSGSLSIDPCVTQSGLGCDPLQPNLAYPAVTSTRHRLAIVLNGSGAQPGAYNKLSLSLQADGFAVLAVRYPSNFGTPAACPDANAAADPDCHRAFRSEITFGAGVPDPSGVAYDSNQASVNSVNSLMNRTLRLLQYLVSHYPNDNWAQYQASDGGSGCVTDPNYGVCDLDWSKVVLVGHSLGAGEALYLSKFHAVDRVEMLSGPFDEYTDGATITVAPWIAEGGFVTPLTSMFALDHTAEPTAAQQHAAWDALGLAGPLTSVDGSLAPYDGAQQLTTSATPACAGSNSYHNSTGQDLCVTGSPPALTMAWQYMAGG